MILKTYVHTVTIFVQPVTDIEFLYVICIIYYNLTLKIVLYHQTSKRYTFTAVRSLNNRFLLSYLLIIKKYLHTVTICVQTVTDIAFCYDILIIFYNITLHIFCITNCIHELQLEA